MQVQAGALEGADVLKVELTQQHDGDTHNNIELLGILLVFL